MAKISVSRNNSRNETDVRNSRQAYIIYIASFVQKDRENCEMIKEMDDRTKSHTEFRVNICWRQNIPSRLDTVESRLRNKNSGKRNYAK